MKKMKFLGGISAAFALAAVALATTFTSCEKEEFNVEAEPVEPANATVTIKANFVLLENGASRVLGDNEVKVSYTPSDYIVGKPAIEAQTVKITAEYEEVKAELNVSVPAVEAGQIMHITPTIVLTRNSKFTYDDQPGSSRDTEVISVGEIRNYTDYWYTTTGEYIMKTGQKVESVEYYTEDLLEKKEINDFAKALGASYKEETIKMENPVYVYAHSMTTIEVTYGITEITYDIWRNEEFDKDSSSTRAIGDKVLIGNIVIADYKTTTVANPVTNQQIPGHSHAPAYHGHGHGGDNAGGGIVWAD